MKNSIKNSKFLVIVAVLTIMICPSRLQGMELVRSMVPQSTVSYLALGIAGILGTTLTTDLVTQLRYKSLLGKARLSLPSTHPILNVGTMNYDDQAIDQAIIDMNKEYSEKSKANEVLCYNTANFPALQSPYSVQELHHFNNNNVSDEFIDKIDLCHKLHRIARDSNNCLFNYRYTRSLLKRIWVPINAAKNIADAVIRHVRIIG